MKKHLFSLLLILLFLNTAKAQNMKGIVNGVVFETEFNRVIPTVTLSVYNRKDSSIINYTLTDGDGIFRISNLPIAKELYIIASFVGYRKQKIDFKIGENGSLNLGKINLTKIINVLEEVIISRIPPVSMNGDTLEFNADAFKMDPNAVAEDLLKKLPGVVVWGDGTITVNGKEISNLFVNGKPFFGGDTKIAIQNIEKNAIKKIQVYQKELNRTSNDSISEINIQFKDQKNMGYFGKIMTGRGTGGFYESALNINTFNKKTQISGLFGKDNINKENDDIIQMIRNSTYRGSGLNRGYGTNFEKPGVTKSLRGGVLLNHDFQDNVNEKEKNGVNINYLYNNAEKDLQQQNNILTNFGEGTVQERVNQHTLYENQKTNKISGKYDYLIPSFRLNVNGNLKNEVLDKKSTATDSVKFGDNKKLLSSRFANDLANEKSREGEIELVLEHFKHRDANIRRAGDWFLSYKLTNVHENTNTIASSNFIANTDSIRNHNVLRRILYSSNWTNHRFLGRWGNFWNTIATASYDKFLFISYELNFMDKNVRNELFDIEQISGDSEKLNTLLSYNRKEEMLNWAPALTFEKTYFKHLSDRFQKSAKVEVTTKYVFYTLKNQSDRNFQNFTRSFKRLNPMLSFSYRNIQFNEFENNINFTYLTSNNFPTTNQLFPVVDTTNVYSIVYGNASLKPSDKHNLTFDFKHKRIGKNPLSYKIGFSIGSIINDISYKMMYDSSGRTLVTATNVKSNDYITASGNFTRAIKFKSDQIQFKVYGNWTLSELPYYVVYNKSQENLEKSLNTSTKTEFEGLFSRADYFDLGINYSYKKYSSKQGLESNSIISQRHKIEGNTSINFTRKLSLMSNFAYYSNRFHDIDQNYSICNLKISYRFLKKNNLEVVLSGNDILDQNRHVIVKDINNVISQNITNAMGRYFMFSLAYYPRKFGKN